MPILQYAVILFDIAAVVTYGIFMGKISGTSNRHRIGLSGIETVSSVIGMVGLGWILIMSAYQPVCGSKEVWGTKKFATIGNCLTMLALTLIAVWAWAWGADHQIPASCIIGASMILFLASYTMVTRTIVTDHPNKLSRVSPLVRQIIHSIICVGGYGILTSWAAFNFIINTLTAVEAKTQLNCVWLTGIEGFAAGLLMLIPSVFSDPFGALGTLALVASQLGKHLQIPYTRCSEYLQAVMIGVMAVNICQAIVTLVHYFSKFKNMSNYYTSGTAKGTEKGKGAIDGRVSGIEDEVVGPRDPKKGPLNVTLRLPDDEADPVLGLKKAGKLPMSSAASTTGKKTNGSAKIGRSVHGTKQRTVAPTSGIAKQPATSVRRPHQPHPGVQGAPAQRPQGAQQQQMARQRPMAMVGPANPGMPAPRGAMPTPRFQFGAANEAPIPVKQVKFGPEVTGNPRAPSESGAGGLPATSSHPSQNAPQIAAK